MTRISARGNQISWFLECKEEATLQISIQSTASFAVINIRLSTWNFNWFRERNIRAASVTWNIYTVVRRIKTGIGKWMALD